MDDDGVIHRYWLEAEKSMHKVGGPQQETEEERVAAAARGKATASVIGVRALGTRFNVLMTIQVPLQQQVPPKSSSSASSAKACKTSHDASLVKKSESSEDELDDDSDIEEHYVFCGLVEPRRTRGGPVRRAARQIGEARAARVSRGSEHDTWNGLAVKSPKRNRSEHITCTVVISNTISGGVPSEDDVVAAIDDLEALYASCAASGSLADPTFDFMKKELTMQDEADVVEKVTTQPYVPP